MYASRCRAAQSVVSRDIRQHTWTCGSLNRAKCCRVPSVSDECIRLLYMVQLYSINSFTVKRGSRRRAARDCGTCACGRHGPCGTEPGIPRRPAGAPPTSPMRMGCKKELTGCVHSAQRSRASPSRRHTASPPTRRPVGGAAGRHAAGGAHQAGAGTERGSASGVEPSAVWLTLSANSRILRSGFRKT